MKAKESFWSIRPSVSRFDMPVKSLVHQNFENLLRAVISAPHNGVKKRPQNVQTKQAKQCSIYAEFRAFFYPKQDPSVSLPKSASYSAFMQVVSHVSDSVSAAGR